MTTRGGSYAASFLVLSPRKGEGTKEQPAPRKTANRLGKYTTDFLMGDQ